MKKKKYTVYDPDDVSSKRAPIIRDTNERFLRFLQTRYFNFACTGPKKPCGTGQLWLVVVERCERHERLTRQTDTRAEGVYFMVNLANSISPPPLRPATTTLEKPGPLNQIQGGIRWSPFSRRARGPLLYEKPPIFTVSPLAKDVNNISNFFFFSLHPNIEEGSIAKKYLPFPS